MNAGPVGQERSAKLWYAVLRYDGTPVYVGRSEHGASVAANPGTVYGKAWDKDKAIGMATAHATQVRDTNNHGK